MSDKPNKSKTWLILGVIVLVILLLVWITLAEASGDTDVAALLMPQIAG